MRGRPAGSKPRAVLELYQGLMLPPDGVEGHRELKAGLGTIGQQLERRLEPRERLVYARERREGQPGAVRRVRGSGGERGGGERGLRLVSLARQRKRPARAARARLLIVGLGHPRQRRLPLEQRNALRVAECERRRLHRRVRIGPVAATATRCRC